MCVQPNSMKIISYVLLTTLEQVLLDNSEVVIRNQILVLLPLVYLLFTTQIILNKCDPVHVPC